MTGEGRPWRCEWSEVDRIQERLLARRVVTAAGCWERPQAATPYSGINIGGRTVGCHIAALWAWKGVRVPKGRKNVAMHLCDNNRCFNPAHIEGNTQRANVRDAIAKGRVQGKGTATACPHGHPFTEANTYWFRGHQLCRQCRAADGRRFRANHKGLLK